MKNPIEKCGFVATPNSMKELQDYAQSITGPEGASFALGMMMAWNLASKLVDEEVAK